MTTTPSPAASSAAPIRGDAQVLSVAPSYEEAQATVDRLSDGGFPVEHVRIVGTDLHSVEQVTGRMTKGRAALAGSASGAWFGLLIGLLIGIFLPGPAWLALLLVSLAFGALWGAFFGFLAHWATRGKRDFASTKRLVATQYEVLVDSPHATQAVRLLSQQR